jgi:bile acid:Na+ symporter, BASS family
MPFQKILDIAIPSITFFLMTIVGMDLTANDFRKVRGSPKSFFVGTMGQYLLPFCAWAVLILLKPIPAVAGGMILIASAPAGGISNYYSSLARANVALSVVLTTVSSIGAALTMPLLLRMFHFLLPRSAGFEVPLKFLFGQLLLLLVIPVLIGLAVHRYLPTLVTRHSKILRRAGFLALGCLIAFIFYQTRALLIASWLDIAEAAVIFILFSMVLGYTLGSVFRLDRKDTFTLLIEYGVRNVAITTATATVVLRQTDFATFAAFYFLIEAALILPIIAAFRRL